MTECGLASGHEGDCVPYTSLKSKRQVSYNQDAILCPFCMKRIRLNNDGRARIHVSGKIVSERCLGSEKSRPSLDELDAKLDALKDEPEHKPSPQALVFEKEPAPTDKLFSDAQ